MSGSYSNVAAETRVIERLYDYVAGTGANNIVEHVDDQTMQSFYMQYVVPHPSGQGVKFPATDSTEDFQLLVVPITNLTVGSTVYITVGFYDAPHPITYIVQETGENITREYGEQIAFVATETTHNLEIHANGVHDEFAIDNVSAMTIDVIQESCTPFFRTIKGDVVTDTTLDGQPYTVVGEVRTSCPDAQTEPTCAITAINTAKDAIVAAINGRPDYTAQLTSIGDTLTAMKSDTAAINTGVASSLVLLQAIVDKPDPTAVDLQPVLDKLDELIALDTTENSTLVDVKNQLIAANVTLSNAETLLMHIDADMHDVVAKLQSALDLLTSLQTLLTTIDGRIAAIQTAITTADANNVSALNDIRTELQAINVNTDTLEALITAGNVLLTAIVNNTDGVEGLLTEIRDLPVTDSWLLLYDMVEGAYETITPLDAWSTTGGVTAVGNSLTVTSNGTATITVMLPKPATPKTFYFRSYDGLDGISIYANGEVVPNPIGSVFYTGPDGEATIEFIFSGFVGELIDIRTYADGSKGGCKPFIRRIVDNVVTDTELDLTTPYTVVGEVRTSCPDAQTEPTCACTDELQALQASVDSIAALFSGNYANPTYSYRTARYVVMNPYKSLTVTFINGGMINGVYVPAGYSFSHPRVIGTTYDRIVILAGTGFAVWEDR